MNAMMKVMLTGCLAGTMGFAANLIDNGDFSQADASGKVIGFVQGAANAQFLAPALKIKKEGEISYLQVSLGEKEKTRFRPEIGNIPVSKGKTYKVLLRARGTGNFMVVGTFLKKDRADMGLCDGWQNLSTEWADYSFSWTAAEDGAVMLMFQIMGPVDVDEWVFEEMSDAPDSSNVVG